MTDSRRARDLKRPLCLKQMFIAVMAACAVLAGTPSNASDIKARLNTADESTSFQVTDNGDSVSGQIDSGGDLLLLGSATSAAHWAVTNGQLGIGTQTPDSKVHISAANGTSGPQMIVSTGSVKLFEVSGSSVLTGVPLYFPNGSEQNRAYTPSQAGVLAVSSVSVTGTITSSSALISGALESRSASSFDGSVRISTLSVIGEITSTSPVRGGAAFFRTVTTNGSMLVASITVVGTVTSSDPLSAASVRAILPSEFDDAVQISSLSVIGTITSTGDVRGGAAAFTTIVPGIVSVASMTSVGTISSTSSLISGGIAAPRQSTFSALVEISSLTATGTITSTSAVSADRGIFSSLSVRGAVNAASLNPIGTLTSTSALIAGAVEANLPSRFLKRVQVSSLSVIGEITSTSAVTGRSANFSSLDISGVLRVSSLTSVGTLTSTSAFIVGGLDAGLESVLNGVRISSLAMVGALTSTSAIRAGAATFSSLIVNGTVVISSLTVRGTFTSTSSLITGAVRAASSSEFEDTVQISSLAVIGTITSTDSISVGAAQFLTINPNELNVPSITVRGSITSTSSFAAGAILVPSRASIFNGAVWVSSLATVGTITSTSALTAGSAMFTSISIRGAVTVASMTPVGTITSTSPLTAGGVLAEGPATLFNGVRISSLSTVGTIRSTSAITAGAASFSSVMLNGFLRVSSVASLGTITSTSAFTTGEMDVDRPSIFNGSVRVSSLELLGDFTSTTSLIVGGIDAEFPSLLNGAVRISSLAVTGELTSTNTIVAGGVEANFLSSFTESVRISSLAINSILTSSSAFIGGRSSFTALYVGAKYDNFAADAAGNVGVGTTTPKIKLMVMGPEGSAGVQLIVSTGTEALFEVTGASTTIDNRMFTVTSTATHFMNPVLFSTTVYITGQSGGPGNLLVVSTGTLAPSVRNAFLRVSSTGTVSVFGKGAFGAGGADVAEMYGSDETLEPGDLVAASGAGKVRKSLGGAAGEHVLGIVSARPGLVLGLNGDMGVEEMTGSYPVALKGRTPAKVSLENGPIAPGDLLSASAKPGYVAKAVRSGRVVGTALEAYPSEGGRNAEIMTFLYQHFWVNPDDYNAIKRRIKDLERRLAKDSSPSEFTDD